MPVHDAGLTILPKKKKKTLKVTKLTSCMNFRMIQAANKCFERSTVERIEENSNVSRCLFIRCKYGHLEMRNKNLINRTNDITQGWQFYSPLISPWKRKGKKRKLSQHGVFVVAHPAKYYPRRSNFPFRKQAMPFLTVDAFSDNSRCHL